MKVTSETFSAMQTVLLRYIPATREAYVRRNNKAHPSVECLLLDAWGYYVNDLRQGSRVRPPHLPQPLTPPLANPPSISGTDTLFYIDNTNDKTLMTALKKAFHQVYPNGLGQCNER